MCGPLYSCIRDVHRQPTTALYQASHIVKGQEALYHLWWGNLLIMGSKESSAHRYLLSIPYYQISPCEICTCIIHRGGLRVWILDKYLVMYNLHPVMKSFVWLGKRGLRQYKHQIRVIRSKYSAKHLHSVTYIHYFIIKSTSWGHVAAMSWVFLMYLTVYEQLGIDISEPAKCRSHGVLSKILQYIL